ncbi:NADH:ubiquinone reductase (Na(+)-transporting) subunit C [Candidatus Neptunochlamydia vexilliferae]|uniref:NADH:ubiquinone reductase (Na(+)-transporting) subunit C n=1 Tax=Candidatus Neptunichlamydia vexilliferae TaxID=1651774 RepID=UPI0018914DAD|nr:NADH:ubiquinone reductase (Na(+)-transporting) subunit C [Candidatus Neptunochlamydia vexilliferae]
MTEKRSSFSSLRTLLFVVILSTACALVLSILAEFLKAPQKDARELYRSKQLLVATRILGYQGHFLLDGKPAIYHSQAKILIPYEGKTPPKAKNEEILALFETRIFARLTNRNGDLYTFEEVGIDEEIYLTENEKLGYAELPYKLVYLVKQNTPSKIPYGYVIPINGYGLWDAIYGYLGIKANGDTVLGMTWYSQKETPGLGAEISLPEWQEQFFGKDIFQKSPGGMTNFERAPLGIKVVKTTVEETLGKTPMAESAVDGIPGASITVSGVNEAFRRSLAPYRPFLIRANQGEFDG